MGAKINWREASTLIIISRSFIKNDRLAKHRLSTDKHYAKCVDTDFKVLALKRSKKTSFMPGGYVFPGGTVHDADMSNDWYQLYNKFGYRKENLPSVTAASAHGTIFQSDISTNVEKTLSLRITAIRETFEECGVLLCKNTPFVDEKPSYWASFVAGHEIRDWQKKVQDDPSEFIKLCKHFDCYPDVWSLQLWSNWLTPVHHPKRFDTAFFIAAFDQVPPVFIDNSEIIGFKWCAPDVLLDMCNNKDIWLPPPQYYELARLKNFNLIDELAEFAARKNTLKCERWMPVQMKTSKGQLSLLPGDFMYPKDPVYESGEELRLAGKEDEAKYYEGCEGKPMHRMEMKGVDNTRLVVKNIHSNDHNILPLTEDETSPQCNL